MEHFSNPFGVGDFASSRALENQRFFEDMSQRAQSHRFYAHPFLGVLGRTVAPETVSVVLTSFYKIVSPFTALLCRLGGQAPDLKTRFALMDNIYEEMGCGSLDEAHPRLYLKMLESIGVSAEMAESAPVLPSIRRINEHLLAVVDGRPFSVACAVLASAEATIPPSFPVLATLARRAHPGVDSAFFDRHGTRDEGHSDDASMLFAVSADSSHYPLVEEEVTRDLDLRVELFDEWMTLIERAAQRRSTLSERPRPISIRPGANRPSAPPPA